MSDEKSVELFKQYYNGTASAEQMALLRSMLEGPDGEKLLEQLMEGQWKTLHTADTEFVNYKKEAMWQSLKPETNNASTQALYPQPRHRRIWWAAAVILILLGSGIWFWPSGKMPDADGQIASIAAIDAIQAPAGVNAVLLLSNGQKIMLDTTSSGLIASEGNSSLIKSPGGDLIYNSRGTGTAMANLNTLLVPAGSKVTHMTLADGTQVWLNADSKLTYPVQFNGNQRTVALSGEAYFEVSHNASKPFQVKVRDQTVEVLGTHFNINAYEDETSIKTTLLEGKVIVRRGQAQLALKPGEQVICVNQPNQPLQHILHPDMEAVMAWKSGLFNFNNKDLGTIMRQISRWYGVQIRFEGPIAQRKFGGELPKDLKLSEILQLLAKMNIQFSMEGNVLTISQ